MDVNQADAQFLAVYELPQQFWKRSEASLSNWWFQEAHRRGMLKTIEGEALIILDPGILNEGPGPDVLQAHLVISDREVAGSVEFHQRGSDWYRHGHEHDAAYTRVVLHVVFEDAGGPDIPTLRAPQMNTGVLSCVATRPVEGDELLQAARSRFSRKMTHLTTLRQAWRSGYNELVLGMVEILCAGPGRARQLHHSAPLFNLDHWPCARQWQGSLQHFPRQGGPLERIHELPRHKALFNFQQWEGHKLKADFSWEYRLNPFKSLGISASQYREWVVNILLPFWGPVEGWGHWQSLRPFRHYGLEKRMLARLGRNEICSIAEQQALLGWYQCMCKANQCHKCPLH